MENKRAHLDMIQGVVNRLSNNSFLLKGWSVVLVSALFALAAGKANAIFVCLAYLPAVGFWALDAYFLCHERLFRALYDHVRQLEEKDVDFSMDTSIVRSKVAPWKKVMLCKTLLIFHGTVLGSILVVTLLMVWFMVCIGKEGQ